MQYYFTINCTNRLWEAAGTFSQVQCASLLQPISAVPGVYKVRLVVTRQHYAIIWVAVDYKHVAPLHPFSQRTEEISPQLQVFFRKDILRNLFQGHLLPLGKEEFQRNTDRPQMVRHRAVYSLSVRKQLQVGFKGTAWHLGCVPPFAMT